MEKVVFFLHRVYPFKGSDDLSLKDFERILRLIKSRFKVVTLPELLGGKVRGRAAAITFDDGYLDNWVYAYPILKRLGLKAHLFITSGRISQEVSLRPTLFDYWEGKVSFKELFKPSSMGEAHLKFFKEGLRDEFLSWEELSKMADTFTFGAHGLYHGKLPVSDRVLDFYDGKNFTRDYLFPTSELFVGKPLFRCKSSLSGPAFVPSKEFFSLCKEFPKTKGWKERLRKELSKLSLGRFETDGEASERILKEVKTSNSLIKENLGVEPETFSWPFGHYTPFSKELLSKEYKFIFTTKRGIISESSDYKELPRVPLGKDLFTASGRVLTFSTPLYKLYRKLKKEKSL
ncbi:polysaccharide deacetylase family protein [Thermovibrio sp.]